MTKKYVVKNCPSFIDFDEQSLFENLCKNGGGCQDCTDCVIKQIIERCKVSTNYHSKDMYILGRTNMAGIVLALLHVEAVEQ